MISRCPAHPAALVTLPGNEDACALCSWQERPRSPGAIKVRICILSCLRPSELFCPVRGPHAPSKVLVT